MRLFLNKSAPVLKTHCAFNWCWCRCCSVSSRGSSAGFSMV